MALQGPLMIQSEDFLQIEGRQKSTLRTILFFILPAICTGGLYLLVCAWFPQWYSKVTSKKVDEFPEASHVLLQAIDKSWTSVPLQRIRVRETVHLLFKCRCEIYIYDDQTRIFVPARVNIEGPFSQLLSEYGDGIDERTAIDRASLVGQNLIEIEVKSIPTLLLTEAVHPFYIFQVCSCLLWFMDNYYYYASAIVLLSTCSISWTIYYTRQNMLSLREMAQREDPVTVFRSLDNHPEGRVVSSSTLVPGDIIEVTTDMPVLCDLLLLSGECVVNESMLTGESNPVVKYAAPITGEIYKPDTHKKFTLFCGTQIMHAKSLTPDKKIAGQGNSSNMRDDEGQPGGRQAGKSYSGVKALVIRTGFQTSKGGLFKSILYPKPLHFKFYSDSYKFLLIMIVIGIVGLIKSLVDQMNNNYELKDAIFNSLDLLTIIVPPALPLIMTMGIGISVDRLKQKQIYCTSPPRINFAGKIDCMCFDKTGTLTEENLGIDCLRPVTNTTQFDRPTQDLGVISSEFLHALASAHSVTFINGRMMGHPVDFRMFEFTQWRMEEMTPSRPYKLLSIIRHPDRPSFIEVLRRFEFEPKLQRMSVIIRPSDQNQLALAIKGSPEAITELCQPHTVPADIGEVLEHYGREGHYVLACAYRSLPDIPFEAVDSLQRDDLEQGLTFCGLLVLENKLKEQTTKVIKELRKSEVHCVMITGDNLYTGISVAKKCGILDEDRGVLIADIINDTTLVWVDLDNKMVKHDPLISCPPFFQSDTIQAQEDQYIGEVTGIQEFDLAISGKALAILSRSPAFPQFLQRIKVYGRATPDQKTLIVEGLIDLGMFVGMTGDGTNDCGALRAAHMGVSLSEAEASVVAPFTDRNKSVASITTLIGEGRCALTTTFVAFKYMILYPVIQYTAVLRLYQIQLILGDLQYLYQDLALVLPLSIAMLYTKPYKKLVKRRPTSNLLSASVLLSLFFEISLVISTLILINWDLSRASWFSKYEAEPDQKEFEVEGQEDTVTFLFSNFQYISSALAFSSGPPFRRHFWTNWPYVVTLIFCISANVFVCYCPKGTLYDWLQFVDLHDNFQIHIIVLAAIHCALAIFIQFIVLEGPIGDWIRDRFFKSKSSSSSSSASSAKKAAKKERKKSQAVDVPRMLGYTMLTNELPPAGYSASPFTPPSATNSSYALGAIQ